MCPSAPPSCPRVKYWTVPRPATVARGVDVWHDCGRRNDLPPASHPYAGKTSPFHDAACGFAEKSGNGTVSLRAKGARCVYPVFVAGERKGITSISVKYILHGHPNLAPTHSIKGIIVPTPTCLVTTQGAALGATSDLNGPRNLPPQQSARITAMMARHHVQAGHQLQKCRDRLELARISYFLALVAQYAGLLAEIRVGPAGQYVEFLLSSPHVVQSQSLRADIHLVANAK